MIQRLLVACLLLFIVSCKPATPPESTPESTTPSSSTLATPPPTTSAPSTAVTPNSNSLDSSTQQNRVGLALSAEGLQLVVKDTGSARLLPFDAERKQVVTAVTNVRGEPIEQGRNSECQLEYTSWSDGLTLYSSKDHFVGWNVNSRRPKAAKPYTTMASIGIGSTRAELDGAYSTLVKQTSLGTEFSAGNLYGILEGTGEDAKVTNLWAGRTCIFR